MRYVPVAGPLPLDTLAELAGEFDRIEPGATYPARAFVQWLSGERAYRETVAAAERERSRQPGVLTEDERRERHAARMREWRAGKRLVSGRPLGSARRR